jgi:hypothetical protein
MTERPFEAWQNFYVMSGAAAATLTGLMFVVITLVNAWGERPHSREGIQAYSTPTVVHFAAALLASAILCAPWPQPLGPGLVGAGALLSLIGAIGAIYLVALARRARRLVMYKPKPQDWIYYDLIPFLAYGIVFVSGFMLIARIHYTLFMTATGVVLLLFVGIHNAWDIVTFLALNKPEKSDA